MDIDYYYDPMSGELLADDDDPVELALADAPKAPDKGDCERCGQYTGKYCRQSGRNVGSTAKYRDLTYCVPVAKSNGYVPKTMQ